MVFGRKVLSPVGGDVKPPDSERLQRWYFGGLAACGATCFTHPLDLLKVQLQTQQDHAKILKVIGRIWRDQGPVGFYQGLSASLFRQILYSTTRFGIYAVENQNWPKDKPIGTPERAVMATVAGVFGGIVANPGDIVNVRMQNDNKLPLDQRRNYAHIIDGLYRITKTEGVSVLFKGVTIATTRAVVMSVTQFCAYDALKIFMVENQFKDGLVTHFSCSLTAATLSVLCTQPLDVIKTRIMNSRPEEYHGIYHTFKGVMRLGPSAFFKGLLPSFMRIGPQTILTFMFLEQLRLHFGYFPKK